MIKPGGLVGCLQLGCHGCVPGGSISFLACRMSCDEVNKLGAWGAQKDRVIGDGQGNGVSGDRKALLGAVWADGRSYSLSLRFALALPQLHDYSAALIGCSPSVWQISGILTLACPASLTALPRVSRMANSHLECNVHGAQARYSEPVNGAILRACGPTLLSLAIALPQSSTTGQSTFS